MANVILPTYEGPVVKIGEQCYQFKQFTLDPPTNPGGQRFENCEDCRQGSSSSEEVASESSAGSSSESSQVSSLG